MSFVATRVPGPAKRFEGRRLREVLATGVGGVEIALDDEGKTTAQRGGELSAHAYCNEFGQGGLRTPSSYRRTTRSLCLRRRLVCMRETPSYGTPANKGGECQEQALWS